MHARTKALLKSCKDSDHVCPKKVGEPMRPFLSAVRAALSQVSECRLDFAEMTGIETDPEIRARLAELDQKMGAAEREARKLMDQAIKVQEIFRQFRDAEARIREELGK